MSESELMSESEWEAERRAYRAARRPGGGGAGAGAGAQETKTGPRPPKQRQRKFDLATALVQLVPMD